MITPAGSECGFYYEDFQRGANRQECRAAKDPRSPEWGPPDCERCPVPDVLAANGSPHLVLTLSISRRKFRFGHRVEVDAWCSLHDSPIAEARVGCAECNADADDLLRRAFD